MIQRKDYIMDSTMTWWKLAVAVFALGIAWASFSSQLEAHVKDMDTLLKITRLVCQNTAKTEMASARCWE